MLEALLTESLPPREVFDELRRISRTAKADAADTEHAIRELERDFATLTQRAREMSAMLDKGRRYTDDIRRLVPFHDLSPAVRKLIRSSLTLLIDEVETIEDYSRRIDDVWQATYPRFLADPRNLRSKFSRRVLRAARSFDRAASKWLAKLQKRREELIMLRTLVSPAKRGPVITSARDLRRQLAAMRG